MTSDDLKAFRVDHGFSIRDLAGVMEISTRNVRRMLKGDKLIPDNIALNLAQKAHETNDR